MCDDRSKTMWRERCSREAENGGVRRGEGVEGVVAHRTMAAVSLGFFLAVCLCVSICLREKCGLECKSGLVFGRNG